MRGPRIYIAIPASLVSDVPHLREKTAKVGYVARACAIHGVERIYAYHDMRGLDSDLRLIKTILEYLDLPQYLRRRVYGHLPELRYAGLLPPLRTPHHKPSISLEELREGDCREGIVIVRGSSLMVDIGLAAPILLEGSERVGKRVTAKIISPHPSPLCRVVSKDEVGVYWGYEVRVSRSLTDAVKEADAGLTILTSRKGASITDLWPKLVTSLKSAEKVLLAFGAPTRGIFEILRDEGKTPEDIGDLIVNLFPEQSVATVRTEEALSGALAILGVGARL